MTDLLTLAQTLEQAQSFFDFGPTFFAAVHDRGLPLSVMDRAEYLDLNYETGGGVNLMLTLVPEGWTVARIGQDDHKLWWVELRQGFATSFDNVVIAPAHGGLRGCADPVLALGAAILRAKAVR